MLPVKPYGIIHECILDDDIGKLKRVLLLPENVRQINDNGCHGTPLCTAITHENLIAVDILLRFGADPLKTIADNIPSPFSLAIEKGNLAIVQRLWAEDQVRDNAHGYPSFPNCLEYAARHGQATLMEFFLVFWGSMWSDEEKEAALATGSAVWHAQVVEVMLAKINFCKEALVRALRDAVTLKPRSFDLITPHSAEYDAVNQGLVIASLIKAGADPDLLNERGESSLIHAACDLELTPALEALLANGADPNATENHPRSDGKRTALHLLSSPIHNNHEVRRYKRHILHEAGIKLLLQYGACILQRDEQGNTPLHYAAFAADLRVVQMYLSSHLQRQQHLHKQDIRQILAVENIHGETLLHWAAAGGKLYTVMFLIAQGLDVNVTSSNGWTPLLCALATTIIASKFPKKLRSAVDIARLLLSNGANASVSTTEGWTALHCLAHYKDTDEFSDAARLADELILKGASKNASADILSDVDVASILFPTNTRYIFLHGRYAWGSEVSKILDMGKETAALLKPGLTPLHCAVVNGALGVGKSLLRHNAVVDALAPDGTTPIELAKETASGNTTSQRFVQLFEEARVAAHGKRKSHYP